MLHGSLSVEDEEDIMRELDELREQEVKKTRRRVGLV